MYILNYNRDGPMLSLGYNDCLALIMYRAPDPRSVSGQTIVQQQDGQMKWVLQKNKNSSKHSEK